MNNVFRLKNQDMPVKTAACKGQIKYNALALVLLVFVMVAAMQTVQLGNLLSEAKAVGKDVRGLRAEQQLLRAQYTAYGNNLSLYLEEGHN